MSRIPLVVICCLTLFVVVGEILCGTDPYFATGIGIIFIAVGITYNALGGLKTISGILFADFAIRTVVISQFFKIFLREPADLNIEAAHLTIAVYVVFYCCLAASSPFFARIRLPLLRPVEARTEAQAHILYWIALAAGAIGTALFDIEELNPQQERHLTASHSLGLALSNLLYFALVLAIDERIRKTGGRHSAGWPAAIPFALIWISAILGTQRGIVFGAVVLYALVCYFRGFRFRRKHLAAAIAFSLFFFLLYSPFELYSRRFVGNQYFTERVGLTLQAIEQHPNMAGITNAAEDQGGWGEGRTGYLSGTQSNALQRPTLIWEDSALISACASGYHYGWTSIEMDVAHWVPRFLNPNKPEDDASAFVGRVSGVFRHGQEPNPASLSSPVRRTAGTANYAPRLWPKSLIY